MARTSRRLGSSWSLARRACWWSKAGAARPLAVSTRMISWPPAGNWLRYQRWVSPLASGTRCRPLRTFHRRDSRSSVARPGALAVGALRPTRARRRIRMERGEKRLCISLTLRNRAGQRKSAAPHAILVPSQGARPAGVSQISFGIPDGVRLPDDQIFTVDVRDLEVGQCAIAEIDSDGGGAVGFSFELVLNPPCGI